MAKGFETLNARGDQANLSTASTTGSIGLLELSEEVAALPIGKSIGFGDDEGRWYEVKKVQLFQEKNGTLAVQSEYGMQTFPIQNNTVAECANLLARAAGAKIQDIPFLRKKEQLFHEFNLKKFNCRDFCRETYEELVRDKENRGNVYIGRISIGEVLIKLKLEGDGMILAQFLVLDEEAWYDQTEDGRPYDDAHMLLLKYSDGMDYDAFIQMAKRSFARYISNYGCNLYQMSEKILHHRGERIYIDGEIRVKGRIRLVRSAATVLDEEAPDDSILRCRIDNMGNGKSWNGMVPVEQIASPFVSGYYGKIKKGCFQKADGREET